MLDIQTGMSKPADTHSAPVEMMDSHKQDRATHHMAGKHALTVHDVGSTVTAPSMSCTKSIFVNTTNASDFST